MNFLIHDQTRVFIKQGHFTRDELAQYNASGVGVFETWNKFTDDRREECISSIDWAFTELDTGVKNEQFERLKRGLFPSRLIESKRGLHVGWKLKQSLTVADLAAYKDLQKALAARYDGDTQPPTAGFRVPGFRHSKDPENAFMVREVWNYPAATYDFKTLYQFYGAASTGMGDVDNVEIDCPHDYRAMLLALSGTEAVRGDTIDVRGSKIWCNNKPTSGWIDEKGWIGTHDGHGPTIERWLSWYTK